MVEARGCVLLSNPQLKLGVDLRGSIQQKGFQFNPKKAQPNDEQIVEEVAEEIERRIENLEISIAESEAEGCPEEMEEVHNRIIESLELYCEGLSYFIEYIEDSRDEYILNAFKLIFQGDIITKELKQNIMEELKDRPRSSVA
jgi:hypothetical protein